MGEEKGKTKALNLNLALEPFSGTDPPPWEKLNGGSFLLIGKKLPIGRSGQDSHTTRSSLWTLTCTWLP